MFSAGASSASPSAALGSSDAATSTFAEPACCPAGWMRPKPPVSAAATPTPARTPTAAAAATMAPMGRLRAAGCSSRPEAAEAAGLGATATGGCTAVDPGRLPGAAAGARSDPTALAPPDAGVWGTVGSAASTASATPAASEPRATASRGTTRSTGAPQFVQNFTSSAIWLPHRVQNISTDLPAPPKFLALLYMSDMGAISRAEAVRLPQEDIHLTPRKCPAFHLCSNDPLQTMAKPTSR